MEFFLLFPVMSGGLTIVAVATAWALVNRTRRLRAAALMNELAVAARRGLPMAEELDGLSETLLRGDRNRVHRSVAALHEGADLRTALRAGTLIPASSQPVLAAGEATGRLPQAFADEAARLTRQSRGGAAAIWNVGFYLLVTLFAIQTVLGFLLYYIVPKFKKIFEDFGLSMDTAVQGQEGGLLGVAWSGPLIQFSSFAVKYWFLPMMALQLVAFALPVYLVLRQRGLRLPGGRWARRWIGSRRAHASRIARALANAAESERPFPPVLTAYAAAADSRGPALSRLARKVEHGADVWPALRSARLLTAGEARLAASGTAAGNLPTVLRLIADRRDGDEARRRGWWLGLLQPAAILLVGAMVAWIGLAFFTPLIRLLYDLGGPL